MLRVLAIQGEKEILDVVCHEAGDSSDIQANVVVECFENATIQSEFEENASKRPNINFLFPFLSV